MTARTERWCGANQRYLVAALATVRSALERLLAGEGATPVGNGRPASPMEEAAAAMPAPSALDTLCDRFRLSPFERDVLLLCAGVELSASFAALCAAVQVEPGLRRPSFGLALAALPGAHWSALSPRAPLRRWHLIEVGAGDVLTGSPLRIDERVLHYLTGVDVLDESLASVAEPVASDDDLVPSHRVLVERLATIWSRATAGSRLPVLQLCGPERDAQRAVASAVSRVLGLDLHVVRADAVPTGSTELQTFARLWDREAALSGRALLLDCHDPEPPDPIREGAIARLVDGTAAPLVVAVRERRFATGRPTVTADVGRANATERRALWRRVLGEAGASVNGGVDDLAAQFPLGVSGVRAACAETLGAARGGDDPGAANLPALLWDACRRQARPRLGDLAQRIESSAGWEDLVLPEPERQLLAEIGAQVRWRTTVYETWGFAARGGRGLGISALFVGPSGTGKTMAAEVLARELRLDLYRIDLSQVVSKYIGETEKNLRRVFDAAEDGGAVLLFDEADALFGKRSEVKDSHDRYANIEVSYLLQRMEAYRGLAILTTNSKSALDPAFLRRLRFVVHFPFPDAAQRAEIWRRVFPPGTPTAALDPALLARLNVSGGAIRNIALGAAFLAADGGEPVRMTHLARAARSEYAKHEKALTEAEIRGWA